MPDKDTSVAIKKLYIYRSQMKGMIQFDQCLNQDTIHTATILWLINATIQVTISLATDVNTDTSNELISVNLDTIHTATFQWLIKTTIQGGISLAIDVNTDTSNQ